VKVLVQIKCMGADTTDLLKGNFNLNQDLANIMGPGSRVAKAMCDFLVHRAHEEMRRRHDGGQSAIQTAPDVDVPIGWIALKNVLQFRKSIENAAFENSSQIFAQLEKIGTTFARYDRGDA
jgi:hypothetical protein